MLEKPDLPEEQILACLHTEYGLQAVQIAFLPIGWQYTAVYRVLAADNAPYFVKLIRGAFDEAAVTLPKFLSDHGITQIIAPLATGSGKLWTDLDGFKVILYPFVEGISGFNIALSDRHLVDFGRALKAIHTSVVPPLLISFIQQETYAPKWREMLMAYLARVLVEAFTDPIAVELAVFLTVRRDEILALIGRTKRLAQSLQTRSLEFVLCHSDLHAGNLLAAASGALYIVDWDNPVLAPRERDLMFVGAGWLGVGRTLHAEEAVFYQGYGQTSIDYDALAYYRYERTIEDLAVDCELIFLTEAGTADRAKALQSLKSNFLPNSPLSLACQSDKSAPSEVNPL